MPVQTTKSAYFSFPDGGKVSVNDGTGWFDIGGINSAVSFTLNYTENQITTANAGKTAMQVRDMLIDGSLTLINLEPDAIKRMSGGIMSLNTTAGSSISAANFTNQSIVGFTAMVPVHLEALVTASASRIQFSTTPVFTSVTASSSGALTVNDDYFIIRDYGSSSGYSLLFNPNGTATVGTSETITVDYDDNVPVASYEIYAGTSTQVLTAFGLKIEHTNSSSVIDRSFEIYSGNPTSGGFVFGFKGANEDGLDEMPLTFRGDLDTTRADGQQLFRAYQIASA